MNTCTSFEVQESVCPPSESGKRYPVFRDPAGIRILSRISAGLLRRGYHVTPVRPACGIEAGCECRLTSGFKVDVILGVLRRQREFISCGLITRHFPPLINRLLGVAETNVAARADEWRELCRAIEHEVIESFGVTSVVWLTENEADKRWTEME